MFFNLFVCNNELVKPMDLFIYTVTLLFFEMHPYSMCNPVTDNRIGGRSMKNDQKMIGLRRKKKADNI